MPSPRDLPDALILLAVSAPSAAHAQGAEPLPEVGASLLRVAASLGLVLALLLALAMLLRRARAHSRAARSGPRLETVDRMEVGSRREIRLVRAGERMLVVGITDERMELLAEIDEEPPRVLADARSLRALATSP